MFGGAIARLVLMIQFLLRFESHSNLLEHDGNLHTFHTRWIPSPHGGYKTQKIECFSFFYIFLDALKRTQVVDFTRSSPAFITINIEKKRVDDDETRDTTWRKEARNTSEKIYFICNILTRSRAPSLASFWNFPISKRARRRSRNPFVGAERESPNPSTVFYHALQFRISK